MGTLVRSTNRDAPDAEFHMVRLVYGGLASGFRGFSNRWWAIDYPDAEVHFLPALSRLTNLSVADDSRHLVVTDDRIFQYPFLFMQQPGRATGIRAIWRPNASGNTWIEAGSCSSMTFTATTIGTCSQRR